jgi:hypothetical protein
VSISAFVAQELQTVRISTPVKVGITRLTAGEYKVSWTGTGSSNDFRRMIRAVAQETSCSPAWDATGLGPSMGLTKLRNYDLSANDNGDVVGRNSLN